MSKDPPTSDLERSDIVKPQIKLLILLLLVSLVAVGCTKKAHKGEKFVPAQAGNATTVSVEGTAQPASPKNATKQPAQATGEHAASPTTLPTLTPLPGSATATPAAVPSPTPTENIPMISYRVQPGDTLFSIAQRFGTTSRWLRDYNHLLSDNIIVGQELMVPEPKKPVPTPTPLPQMAEYVVHSGDTLSSIAVKFGTSVDELIRLNHLSSETIQVGMVLKVPQSAQPTQAPGYQSYVVRPGDTLFGLAERFDTTIGELRAFNNLTSDTLRIGQVLRVPRPAPPYVTYVVKQGDTLSLIAHAYNVSPDAIAKANNLQNEDLLVVGQTLRIPTRPITPTPRPVRYHVVRAGETLSSIARQYGATVAQIQAANGINNPDEIYIGQRLLIP